MRAWDAIEEEPPVAYQRHILSHLQDIVEFLGWGVRDHLGPLDFALDPPPIPVTTITHCHFRPYESFLFRESHQIVTILDSSYRQAKAHLVIAHCTRRKVKYFTDM